MKQILIFGILLVLLIGSIGTVTAENNNVTFENKENNTFLFKNETNDTFYGYCIQYGIDSPTAGNVYNVSSNTSSIDNETAIKELIVNNFRGNTANDSRSNSYLQACICYFTSDNVTLSQINSVNISKSMYENLDGVIGTQLGYNKYMVSDGVYNYIFEFFLGTPNDFITQKMILFTFLIKGVDEPYDDPIDPIDPIDPVDPDINNTTDDPNLNQSKSPNNTNNITEPPSGNVEDYIVNDSSSVNDEVPESNNTGENIVKAISDPINMKETGIPIIALLVLISGIGVIVNRRK